MRYQVQYGGSGIGTHGYIVWDAEAKRVFFENDYKPRCIARAQKLNGFQPINGNEQTYANQVDRYGRAPR